MVRGLRYPSEPAFMRICRILVLSICVWVPLAGSAQNVRDTIQVDSAIVSTGYDLAGITVRVARPVLTTGGASAIILELDSLGALPASSMEEVLRAMPLIVVRQNSRGESQPTLRGSEERQIGVFLDGVPITIGWDHRSDMSIVPMTGAQSVRVVRGSSSVLHGPNTIGGVIEVDIARGPSRPLPEAPVSIALSLEETGGTSLSAATARSIEVGNANLIVRAGAGHRANKGVPLPSAATEDTQLRSEYLANLDGLRLNSDSRRADGYLAARYMNEGGGWAALTTSVYGLDRGVPPEAHQDRPRFWRYPEQNRVLVALSGGSGEQETVTGVRSFEFSFGFDAGSSQIDQYETESFSTVNGGEEADDRTITLRARGDHTLGARGDLRSAFTFSRIGRDEVVNGGDVASYRQRLWGIGIESEWQMGDRDATRFSLGAALDGSDTPQSGDKPQLNGLSDFGFRAGVSSLIQDGLVLHANFSRRSRFPSLRELYSGALGRFVPNPELGAETLLGSEGGLTLGADNSSLQVVGFYQRLKNGIVRSSVVGIDGIPRFKRINHERVKSVGIEVLAVRTMGLATLSGDLTIQDVTGIDQKGLRVQLEYEPTIIGRVGVETPLGDIFRASGTLRFMGNQMCENPEIGGLQNLGSSGTLDLRLRGFFRIHSGSSLARAEAGVGLRNATDASVYDQCGLPQPGRTFQIQIRLW